MKEIIQLLNRFRTYLADPREYGPELLVSVGILIMVCAIFVVCLLWIRFQLFTKRKRRAIQRIREAAEKPPPSAELESPDSRPPHEVPASVLEGRRPLPWGLIFLAAFISLALWIAAGTIPRYTMGKTAYCDSCHSMKKSVKSWRRSRHPKVPCQACHEQPGISGILKSQAQGLSNISLSSFYWSRHRPITLKSPVSPACLSCHQEIAKKTIKFNDTIKVSHRAFIDSVPCESCHPNAGHAGKKLKIKLMDKCVTCHVENKADIACVTCHLPEPVWSKTRLSKYSKAGTTYTQSCLKCHESKMRCEQCHQPQSQQSDEDD